MSAIRFQQIAAADFRLYALDMYGRVWFLEPARHNEWRLLASPQEEPYSERESQP